MTRHLSDDLSIMGIQEPILLCFHQSLCKLIFTKPKVLISFGSQQQAPFARALKTNFV